MKSAARCGRTTTLSRATSTLLCKHARKSCASYHVPGGFQTFRFIAAAPNLKSTLHTFSIPTRGINQYRWRLMERRAVCESSATNYRHIIIWYVNAGSLSQRHAYTHAPSLSPPPTGARYACVLRSAGHVLILSPSTGPAASPLTQILFLAV